ncbi:hypothetical protein [Thalassospira marina]|uniref:hypothetical protein n=1 Tax=Thalassospira marina TaxID=2048283 RepID=UPI0012FE8AED|nr:hypothetical protein [Thalassospira marina]
MMTLILQQTRFRMRPGWLLMFRLSCFSVSFKKSGRKIRFPFVYKGWAVLGRRQNAG